MPYDFHAAAPSASRTPRHSGARRGPRRTLPIAFGIGACIATSLSACRESTAPNDGASRTFLRVVNSAFQATQEASDDDPFGCPCTPVAIDVLIDSAAAAPSVVGMPPASVGAGNVGPAPANLDARYGALAGGVHSFVARVSGPANPTFFTTPSRTAYLPKQYLPGRIYHTLIVAGVSPRQPDSGPPVFAPATAFANGADIPLVTDDPFPGPAVQTRTGPVLQARLRVINAAPFSAGFTGVYLTASAVPPTPEALATTLTSLVVGPRVASPYVNMGAGEYTITFRNLLAGTIYYQAPLTLGAGEVRTLVLQNTVPAGETAVPAGGVPADAAAQYYKLTNVLDNKH